MYQKDIVYYPEPWKPSPPVSAHEKYLESCRCIEGNNLCPSHKGTHSQPITTHININSSLKEIYRTKICNLFAVSINPETSSCNMNSIQELFSSKTPQNNVCSQKPPLNPVSNYFPFQMCFVTQKTTFIQKTTLHPLSFLL